MDFQKEVDLKYYIYDGLFRQLPFDVVRNTGVFLPILRSICEKEFERNTTPEKIINNFFDEHMSAAGLEDRIDMLFNFIKYIEREIVLFDAVESAAFDKINDIAGEGTFLNLLQEAKVRGVRESLVEKLKSFNLRIVLTAHPTQFYPSSVLVIIDQLSAALDDNNIDAISDLLKQLAKTPFFSKKKPSPYEEAKSLVWYLKNVFYQAVSDLVELANSKLKDSEFEKLSHNLITIGFWPGGDRDGNPFVNSEITREVAMALKRAIFRKYHT